MLYLLGGVSLPQNSHRIYVVTPAPRDGWRELVNQTPTAQPKDTPEWIEVLCLTKPYLDVSRYYLFPDGRRFVLPLLRRRGITGVIGRFLERMCKDLSPGSPGRLGRSLFSRPLGWKVGRLTGPELDDHVVAAVVDDLRHAGLRVRPSELARLTRAANDHI